jgi:hypothetical protein
MRVAAKFETTWHYAWVDRGVFGRPLMTGRRSEARFVWRAAGVRYAPGGTNVSARVYTHQPIGSAVIETDNLQPVEIAQQLPPFWRNARFMQQVVEMLLHREGQEGTEHMAADGGVGGMEDRPRALDRLGAQKKIFDLSAKCIGGPLLFGKIWERLGVADVLSDLLIRKALV